MKNLKQIEAELETILSSDKRSWVELYVLLKEVQDNELYTPAFQSFSQWIKDFARRTHTHESILWARLKAGKVYADYQQTKQDQGISVPDLAEAKVAADSLVLLGKINKANKNIAADLADKVMAGELTRADLRQAYQDIKRSKGIRKVSTDPHAAALKEAGEDGERQTAETEKEKIKIEASDIIYHLGSGIDWLTTPKPSALSRFEAKQPYRPVYKLIPEFSVYTGTSRHSRRVDALIAENHTTDNLWQINLHAVEIKVDKNDLINDQKYTEYSDYADYLWIAIPTELLPAAEASVPSGVGIITFDRDDNGNLMSKIESQATEYKAELKDKALSSMLVRVLG